MWYHMPGWLCQVEWLRKRFLKEATIELKADWWEGAICERTSWRKRSPGRGGSECKGPEVGTSNVGAVENSARLEEVAADRGRIWIDLSVGSWNTLFLKTEWNRDEKSEGWEAMVSKPQHVVKKSLRSTDKSLVWHSGWLGFVNHQR